MTEQVSKKRIHYAWFVLASCCALTAGGGICLNAGGQWLVAVTTELGSSITEIALYFSICALCMAAVAPVVGRVLPKVNVRVLTTACYLVCIAAVFAMSTYTAVWQWWISGALLGLAGVFVVVIPVPIILGNWFVKRQGFATGLALSFSGISAAVISPVIAMLISSVGWRMAYVVAAAATAVVVLPFTVFVIRFKPADVGMLPYGADGAEADGAEAGEAGALEAGSVAEEAPGATLGVSAERAMKSVAFWVLFAVCGLFAVLSGFSQVLPAYAVAAGMPSIMGLVGTMCMAGSFVGMLGLGALSDRLGGTATGLIGVGAVLAGILLLIFCGQSIAVALGGGLLYGISLSLINIVTPVLCRVAFGNKDFPKLYSTLMVAVTLTGALGTVIITLIIDSTGSFFPAFWLGCGLCLAIASGIVVSMRAAKGLPRGP